MIAIFSMGVSNFGIQDAHAAADITYTVATTTTTTITVTFSEAMDSATDAEGDWTISTGQTVASEAHTNGQTTMVLTLASALATDATPAVTYAENGNITDTNGGATDTTVVGAVTAVDGLAPVVYSAETLSATTIRLSMSEAMTENVNVPTDFTIGGVGGNPIVTSSVTSGRTITLSLNGGDPIVQSAIITVSYAGNAANDLEDIVDIDLADFSSQLVTNNVINKSANCYDCAPPTLQEAQITISSDSYTLTAGDQSTHITANVGDEILVLLKIIDNKSTDTIPFVGLYTNFVEKSGDMSLHYTNHYDNSENISASFYEWNVRSDDVAYDSEDTVSWSNSPNVTLDGEYLMVPFTMKFTDSMETTQIMVKSSDNTGNYSYESLPVTLEVIGDAAIEFDSNGKVLGFFDESVLSIMLSELNTSDNITTPVSALLGISDDSLPAWTSELAKWTAEDKITSGDLIVAAEYLINN
jgi:hypothetical protein